MAERSRQKNQWISENLDRINLTVEKGKKEVLKSYAENNGESLNGFINRAIDHLIDFEGCSVHNKHAEGARRNNE